MKAGYAGGHLSLEGEEVRPGVISLGLDCGHADVGDVIVFKSEPRLTPGIVLDACVGVKLHDLTLYAACGMGIIAQNSFDLELEHVRICLPPGKNRLVSVSDDGAHFANCGGRIVLRHCQFENQWDDAVNIHGYYRNYVYHYGHLLQVGHFQQLGVPFVRPGEHLLIAGLSYEVKSVHEGCKQYTEFTTVEPLPASLPTGTKVLNLERQPEVEITDCVFRSNKPRGVLVTSGGKVLIARNVFHTPGAAIFCNGDDYFWYEAGPVQDLTIQENIFDNCLYQGFCTSTRAVIELNPAVRRGKSGECYHHNVRILNNVFKDNHGIIIRAKNTQNLYIQHNTWYFDPTYDSQQPKTPIILEHCQQVEETSNILPNLPHPVETLSE